jgi:hypothetical protein
MSTESDCYRLAIRSGVLAADKDRAKWEKAVSLIYEIERAEEVATFVFVPDPPNQYLEFEKCLMAKICEAFG